MSIITYGQVFTTPAKYNVFLDGALVGHIHSVGRQFQYRPLGVKNPNGFGELFNTLQACKDSLGNED